MHHITSRFPPEGHLASVNGIDMYYELHGEGSPLILLHGFSRCSQAWRSHIGEFAKHYRTIPIDFRGHGWSTNPASEFTHRQCALDIFALMDQLDIDQFKAIGHSSGGMILIHMATQQPERVESMILVGCGSYITEQVREDSRRTTVESLSEEDWEVYRQFHKHGDDQIRAWIEQWRNLRDSYDDVNFTPPYLSTIRARTLIVHGDRDGLFPVSIPFEMYRTIPGSYLWIVPNGRHLHPDNFSDRLTTQFDETALEFLSGAWDE